MKTAPVSAGVLVQMIFVARHLSVRKDALRLVIELIDNHRWASDWDRSMYWEVQSYAFDTKGTAQSLRRVPEYFRGKAHARNGSFTSCLLLFEWRKSLLEELRYRARTQKYEVHM